VKRRDFITLLGGAAAAWPAAVRAQQAMPVVGFLSGRSAADGMPFMADFLRGLSEAGYVEGRNVTIEYRWAQDEYDRLPTLAAELVDRRVAVIVANGSPAALAAKTATKAIPIVFGMGADPVNLGLVASLSRPGGNLTGMVNLNAEIGPKRVELIHEAIPVATAVALLINPANSAGETASRELLSAANALALQALVVHASSPRDFDGIFKSLSERRIGALVIGADSFLNAQGRQLAEVALRHRLPAVHEVREFAAAGGLMSYGTSLGDIYRQMGAYTGRVLKGEKPADLPVQQATRVELILNLKTAKALGITFPLTLLGRADEVIE